jgi:hypothetical protein
VKSKQAYDSIDPSLGRVASTWILAPHTVGRFKRAVARLEAVNFTRIAAVHFDAEGSEVMDSILLTTADDSAPGTSPDRAFIILLSPLKNGVAEPVFSQTERNKVAYSKKPVGWVKCRLGQAHINYDEAPCAICECVLSGEPMYPTCPARISDFWPLDPSWGPTAEIALPVEEAFIDLKSFEKRNFCGQTARISEFPGC